MRSSSSIVLVAIAILTLVATWISLPSTFLNIANAKDELYVRRGLDLQGGLQVVLEARPPEGMSVDGDVLSGTRDTIERRVNALGVGEPLIQTRGNNQIVVELPGLTDPEAAIAVLRQTALLEIIDTQGQFLAVGTRVNTSLGPAEDTASSAAPELGGTPEATLPADPTPQGDSTPATEVTPVPTPEPPPAVLGPTYTTIVSGRDIVDAFPTQSELGQIVVGFELRGDAADRFFDFTSQNVGRPMSIVVDKTVINSAEIRDAISSQGTISGLTAQEVRDLSLQLKSGALEVPLEVVQSRTVGPTLGQDSIDRSIVAGIVGLALVAILMILYYRVPGLLSVVALLIYASLVFSLFKLIPVTLTLAGIAGFILSIGMAVDANVLIFARLKEELRTGRSTKAAIEAGFNHAWPSIRDSNISTMITCVILYWFGRYVGASIIQGFALTLFIGVIVSMFTAIIVTRNLMRVILNVFPIRNAWWLGVEREQATGLGD
ncbi:MAG TPA: protein translocase subunit SecD [Thermomicrobiales bacterium]|nr:protein translocase subunit SecD [Thermomicrobiales bacterium]